MKTKAVNLSGNIYKNFSFSNNSKIKFILGPCQIESHTHAMKMAVQISNIAEKCNVDFVFKSSFDKANRTSIEGRRGVGMNSGLFTLKNIKERLKIPILTDVHETYQVAKVAEVADIIQIPAFLCRQTDLLVEAGKTGKIINIKKGQFLAPWDMAKVANKVSTTGNENILLTERGVSFGYNTLVNDMRSLVQMSETGYPIIFDATHSVQQPSGLGESSGGDRKMVLPLAKAAAAVGVAGIFMETHDDPDNAASDGPNNVHIKDLEGIIRSIVEIDNITKKVYENGKTRQEQIY